MRDDHDDKARRDELAFREAIDRRSGTSVPDGINAASKNDQAMMREYIRRCPKRWRGLTAKFKERCVKQLGKAMDEADKLSESVFPEVKAAAMRGRIMAVRTATMMEGQHQRDEHRMLDMAAPRASASITINNDNRSVVAQTLEHPDPKVRDAAKVLIDAERRRVLGDGPRHDNKPA